MREAYSRARTRILTLGTRLCAFYTDAGTVCAHRPFPVWQSAFRLRGQSSGNTFGSCTSRPSSELSLSLINVPHRIRLESCAFYIVTVLPCARYELHMPTIPGCLFEIFCDPNAVTFHSITAGKVLLESHDKS